MERDLLRRVRWGNLGRVAGLAVVVVLVVAWPRLEPAPPKLPGDGARPVVVDGRGSAPRGEKERPVRRRQRVRKRRRVTAAKVPKRARRAPERRAGEGGGRSGPRERVEGGSGGRGAGGGSAPAGGAGGGEGSGPARRAP